MSTLAENAVDEIGTAESYSARNRELRERWIELDGTDTPSAAAERDRIGNEVVTLNAGLLRSIWGRYRSARGSDGDLLAAGQLGLWEAFLSWDVDKAQFTTWAWRHVDGRIRRQVAADNFSGSYLDWCNRPLVVRTIAQLRTTLDRDPTDIEIAAESGLTVEAVRRTRRQRALSVEYLTESDAWMAGGFGEKLVADAAETPRGVGIDDSDKLADVYSQLTPTQLAVLIRCKGVDGTAIDGGPVSSIRETAALLGYNREGMRERLHKAIRYLGIS